MAETLIRRDPDEIRGRILYVRGCRVILDADLARIYGVPTKRLNEQVKRNADRFPSDFAFQLTNQEVADLKPQIAVSNESNNRSQIATGSQKHRDPRFPPYAFTEHGAIMAANVLNSPQAVKMSVFVVRAFVGLRQMLASNAGLARKLEALEKKHDAQFKVVFDAIRQLMAPPEKARRKIGFRVGERMPGYGARCLRRGSSR
ncbi:MAG: hypothetical protein A2V83_02350 [Nitrospirae bacterium RBG_16_64_22]|nr:MAG: hypothetical protein A2V83_02350 [Nitrospirae bacterium RBG_16_64_22]